MDQELLKWIQDNTESKVTERFASTLKQIAEVHDDVGKFISGAKALGKFKGKEEFLEELFDKLRTGKGKGKGSASTRTEKAKQMQEATPKPRKRFVNISLDDQDSEEEDGLFPGIVSKKPQTEKVTFKKLNKTNAAKLKEYSEVHLDAGRELKAIPELRGHRKVPKFQKFEGKEQSKQLTEWESEIKQEETSDLEDIRADQDFQSQDRDWYDNDDDFDPVIQDDMTISVKDSRVLNAELELPEIQLTSLTLKERKKIIPPFLAGFNDPSGEFAIIGSMESSASNKGIINPVKNPESDFSINARRGSRLVAMRRIQKDRKAKSKDATQLKGSAIGDVLGVKDAPSEAKKRQEPPRHEELKSFEEIQAVRRSLPAFKVRNELLRCIRDNQVTIVIGETGSGKTTQLAQFLYEDGFTSGGKMIGCTQPRRVAAVSVAERVAQEMNSTLGLKVGYSIRFEDETCDNTKIKFMTDGILLREAMMDPLLEKYSCIIMDEAHERSLNTDVLLGIFKTLLSKRRDMKLIVTSATMNSDKFSTFFGDSPQYTIPGKTFPVEVIYSSHSVADYVEAAVQKALDIHLSTPITNGDILIFMTGQEDIEATCSTITEKLDEIYRKKYGVSYISESPDFEVLPIYSSLPADVQGRIFRKQEENIRKIIVATNIAETSLTVDGIKYVIDCGYSKLKVYNPKIGLDSLRITPISLANANQRSGRAGRTAPGVAYRLYTADSAVEDMYSQAIPEIQRTNLANTLLQLKSLQIEDIFNFPFIDPPPVQNLMASLYELWALGALDNFGSLTKLGQLMSSFPLQPFLSKILITSAKYGCSEEILTIVSMLSVPPIFYRPKERQDEADQARCRFFIAESDHLTLLNVFAQWKANKFSAHWCNSNFLQYKSLQRAREVRQQLFSVIRNQGLSLSSSGADWSLVRKCICTGYVQQTARLSGLGKYVHLKTGMELKVHPTSALFGLGALPAYVVYHELLMTSNEYINVVTAVDPFWLMELNGIFYHIKRRVDETSCSTSSGTDQDEVDILIEAIKNKNEQVILQLEKDKTMYMSKKPSDRDSKRKDIICPSVSIGLKRRRPF